MTAIVGVFGPDVSLEREAIAQNILKRMRSRGGQHVAIRVLAGATIGVSRAAWELALSPESAWLIADDGDCVIVADATLYYLGDLTARLRASGCTAIGPTQGDLLLAAYRTWGHAFVDRIEGDFSCIVWDRTKREVLFARDMVGLRPLYYAEHSDTLVVASTLQGVAEHPLMDAGVNPLGVARLINWFHDASDETCLEGVRVVRAGETLLRRPASPAQVVARWSPPRVATARDGNIEAAAEQLRGLIVDAVDQRTPASGPTTVWLSGGYDSTALFAAGNHSLGTSGGAERSLDAVSMSYPIGDPGREDEIITQVAHFWNRGVHWKHVDRVPLLHSDFAAAAARRDSPFTQVYEMFNRTLARGSRELGSRVALSGIGGDELFSASGQYLTDLFWGGRWISLANDWRRQRGVTVRGFFDRVVQPGMPRALRRAISVARRGDMATGSFDRPLVPWMSEKFAREHQLLEAERNATPVGGYRRLVAEEAHYMLTERLFPHIRTNVSEMVRDEGVEQRTPLYDRRVIDFAVARPLSERASGVETKILLRRAMRGLLPQSVTAPRRVRTGSALAYLKRSLINECGPAFRHTFAGTQALAELGILDPIALRRSLAHFLSDPDPMLGLRLFDTFQAELWTRAKAVPVRQPEWAEVS
ncbi:MAG: asparagine synthase-related protein [Gemmatimonadales bacterium]